MNFKQFLGLLFWYVTITIGVWMHLGGPIQWAFYATGTIVVFTIIVMNLIPAIFDFYDSLNNQTSEVKTQ